MSFFAPENFLWLAALLPPLLLLYFLKIKRQPVVIGSIMLWQKSLHDLRANAPFQRLRRNLLLFLQILLLLLLLAAMARPIARGSAFSGKHLILVVDRSASMKARDEDGATRFVKAVALATSMAQAPERQEMMVISFANRSRVEIPFTSSSIEVTRALSKIACTDTTTDIRDALRIAHAAARGKTDVRVVLLTDGAVGALPDLEDRNYAVDMVGLGRRADNAAITGLSVRRPLEDRSGGVHLFVEVSNYSEKAREVPLEIRHGPDLIDAATFDIAPGSAMSRTFRFPSIRSGLLQVRLESKDDLPLDDEAVIKVMPPRSPRVILVTDGNVFLENALKNLPGVALTLVAPGTAPAGESGFDVAVFDGAPPPAQDLARSALYLGAVPPALGVDVKGNIETPLMGDGDWNEDHPVNRYVDYSTLFVRQGLLVELPEGASSLLDSRFGSVIAAFEEPSRSVAVFFNPTESDWPFQVSFPVFLHNAVYWLHGGDEGVDGQWYASGAPLRLPMTGPASLTTPGGATVSVQPASDGHAVIRDTDAVGVYRVVTPEGATLDLPVNLLDKDESNTAPNRTIELAGEVVEARAEADRINREYWPWLLIAALGLLLVEWWVYHRRAV